MSKENSNIEWDTFLSTGVDLVNRRIEINMEVSDVMASTIIRALLKMSEISKDPIELYLSTYGGDIYEAFAIYDAITACPCDVVIYASGKIMSAGIIIFLAGDTRVAAPHTRFMLHSVYSSEEGREKDLSINLNESRILNQVTVDILTKRTKMKNPKFWQKKIMVNYDVYFGLTEAKDYGFIKESLNIKKKVVKHNGKT